MLWLEVIINNIENKTIKLRNCGYIYTNLFIDTALHSLQKIKKDIYGLKICPGLQIGLAT